MKSVSLVSGGKSSAYMALKFPTDRYIFNPVLTNDPNCIIKNKSLRQYAQSKVSWFDWERAGCREVDQTLENLRALEQELGQKIEWISAPFTYDDLINHNVGVLARCYKRNRSRTPQLPNARTRICTQALKIYPTAWELYLSMDEAPWVTQIGFRLDEPKRVNAHTCDRTKMTTYCDIKGRYRGKHRHQEIDYRLVTFPLYEERITKPIINQYWYKKGWTWPTVSNCDYCFFHQQSEHQMQFEANPARSEWWIAQEENAGATFDGKVSLREILEGTPIEKSGPLFSCMCHD